jgi:hypothetical protein
MRSSSGLAIFTGLIFLAFFAAMPTILTWQAQNTLAPYGALNKVDFVVQNALDDMKVLRILGVINSLLLTLAGVLVGFRRKSGFYLLVGLCGIAVADAVWGVVEAHSIPGRVVFQFVLWGFMLAFVLHKNHLYGAAWWPAYIDDAG